MLVSLYTFLFSLWTKPLRPIHLEKVKSNLRLVNMPNSTQLCSEASTTYLCKYQSSYNLNICYQVEFQPGFWKECNFQQGSLTSHFISVLELELSKTNWHLLITTSTHTKIQLPGKPGAAWYSRSVTQHSAHAVGECGSCTMKRVLGPALSPRGCSTKPHLKPPQLRN